jgi:hypothetical protein
VKRAAILLPATYPDAMQPGEYHGRALACPCCGVISTLDDSYRIDNGTVTPSWCCPSPSCPALPLWLEFLPTSAN